MSERKYFPINESSARTAHNMMSMRDYSEGSTQAHTAARLTRRMSWRIRLQIKDRQRQREPTDWRNATQRKWRSITTRTAVSA